MKPIDHQSFGDISPGMGRYMSQKDLSPFSKFLSEQSPCIGKHFQKTLSFGPEDIQIPLLTKFRDQSPNFEEQSEQKIELYPRITRQFIQQQQEEKVCKKLDFNQFNQSKSPISKGFQLFNSPMQKNLAITAKKPISYASPKMENIYNELPTAQRAKWNPWNAEKIGNQQPQLDEEELQCSEPDFEEERNYIISPKPMKAKSPMASDVDHHYESMSFSGQSSRQLMANKKYQYINLITLKKKPKENDSRNGKGRKSHPSQVFDINLTARKTKRKQTIPQLVVQPTKTVVCNCKKSKCLKLYCDCFAAGQYCGKDCNCQGCSNNDDHLDERNLMIKQIVDRNPNAFRQKAENTHSQEDHLLRHFKGCNCKKSNCLKKYCECYQIGVKCSELCKCEECKNYDQRHSRIKNHKIRNEDLYYKFENNRSKRIKQY